MQFSRCASALLALFAISSCSVYSRAPSIDEVDVAAGPNTSFIVGSVTQSSDGEPNSFNDRVAFYFRKKGGARGFRLESAEISRPIADAPNEALADRGLEKQHGKLFAVSLQRTRSASEGWLGVAVALTGMAIIMFAPRHA